MSDNVIATETAEALSPDVDTAVDTGAAEADVAPPDADDDQDDGDMFPRKVVEKLRRESADHRGRANTAEEQLTAMQARAEAAEGQVLALQRRSVEQQIVNAGMRPAAVWAVSQLDELLADDGTVDTSEVQRAMATAKKTLGIQQRRNPAGVRDGMNSGSGRPREPKPVPGFTDAFGPRTR